MEQFNLGKMIARQWAVILVLTLVVFGLSYAVYRVKPKGVTGSLTVTVLPEIDYPQLTSGSVVTSQQSTLVIAYAVAATGNWFTDPSVVSQINGQASVAAADDSLNGLEKQFTVNLTNPSGDSYRVEYAAANTTDANSVAQAVSTVMDQQSAKYNAAEKDGIKIFLQYGTPFITANSGQIPLTPIAGLATGLVFGLVIAAALDRRRA